MATFTRNVAHTLTVVLAFSFAGSLSNISQATKKKIDAEAKEIRSMEATSVLDFLVKNEWKNVILFIDEVDPFIIRLMSSMLVKCVVVRIGENAGNASVFIGSSAVSKQSHQKAIIWSRSKWQASYTLMIHRLGMCNTGFTLLLVDFGNSEVGGFLSSATIQDCVIPSSRIYVMTITTTKSVLNSFGYQVAKVKHQRQTSSNELVILPYKNQSIRLATHMDESTLPLRGYHLKIGMLHFPPISSVDRKSAKPKFGGFMVPLLHILSIYLGFSYSLIAQPTDHFGSFSNGTWKGLLGSVNRQEVDMAGFVFAKTLQRWEAVDFTSPVFTMNAAVVIQRQPVTDKKCDFLVYVSPFSLEVWLTCGAMCLVVCMCAILTIKPLLCFGRSIISIPEQTNFGDLMWSFIAALLQTDAIELPDRRSTQIHFFVFMILICLVSKTYLSLLTATLTVKQPPKLYDNLDELIDDGKYGIAMINGGAIRAAIKNANVPAIKRIWNKIKSDPIGIVSTNARGFELVRTGKYVYLTADEPNAAPTVYNSNCTMEILKQRYIRNGMNLVFPKRSPLIEVFSLKILAMRSSGVLQKLQGIYFPKYDPSTCKEKPYMTIPVQRLVGAFCMLAIGVLFSLLFLLLEIIYDQRGKSYMGAQFNSPNYSSSFKTFHVARSSYFSR